MAEQTRSQFARREQKVHRQPKERRSQAAS